jgi:Na+-driven multidrug efflux pump
MLRFAIPSALTHMMYPIATLQITSTINSFGSACVAGGSAATNVEVLTSSLFSAFATALITFMSQNIGAGNRKRVEGTIIRCAILSVAIAAVGPIIYFFFGEEVLSLYVPGDELAIFYGMKRLKYVLAFQMIAALNGIFGAAIQAFGHPFLSAIESVITVLVFRIFWMNFIYPQYETIDALLFCFTCSWILHLILVSATFAFAFFRYKRHAMIQENSKARAV